MLYVVFSLEPRTQNLSNEIMDLRRVNLFTPLSSLLFCPTWGLKLFF